METCKTCIHFKRGHWINLNDDYETLQEQLGGTCKILKEGLMMTNAWMWHQDSIHVQETFGCSLHRSLETT